MNTLKSWLCAGVSVLALGACGGGEVVAVLGSLGAGGGDWLVDADPDSAGYQPRFSCGVDQTGDGQPDELCNININPGSLYERDYEVQGGGNFSAGCQNEPEGRVTDAVNVSVPGCFVGTLLSVNEAVSTDGRVRAYFDFSPDMASGVWVDIHDENHRFVFNPDAEGDGSGHGFRSTGCELTGTSRQSVALTVQTSNFQDFALGQRDGPAVALIPRTTVQALTIQGTPARSFSGEFVGASGLRLVRSGETLELRRRDLAGNC